MFEGSRKESEKVELLWWLSTFSQSKSQNGKKRNTRLSDHETKPRKTQNSFVVLRQRFCVEKQKLNHYFIHAVPMLQLVPDTFDSVLSFFIIGIYFCLPSCQFDELKQDKTKRWKKNKKDSALTLMSVLLDFQRDKKKQFFKRVFSLTSAIPR
jgi:hypothetical protein